MIDDVRNVQECERAFEAQLVILKSLLDPSRLELAELRFLAGLEIDPTNGEILLTGARCG